MLATIYSLSRDRLAFPSLLSHSDATNFLFDSSWAKKNEDWSARPERSLCSRCDGSCRRMGSVKTEEDGCRCRPVEDLGSAVVIPTGSRVFRSDSPGGRARGPAPSRHNTQGQRFRLSSPKASPRLSFHGAGFRLVIQSETLDLSPEGGFVDAELSCCGEFPALVSGKGLSDHPSLYLGEGGSGEE